MKVSDIIARYNAEISNEIDDSLKLTLIHDCDNRIQTDIIDTHASKSPLGKKMWADGGVLYISKAANALDTEYTMDTEVLAPEAFLPVYLLYIDQAIAWDRNDMDRYNAASQRFNTAFGELFNWYSRSHAAPQPKPHHFLHRGGM